MLCSWRCRGQRCQGTCVPASLCGSLGFRLQHSHSGTSCPPRSNALPWRSLKLLQEGAQNSVHGGATAWKASARCVPACVSPAARLRWRRQTSPPPSAWERAGHPVHQRCLAFATEQGTRGQTVRCEQRSPSQPRRQRGHPRWCFKRVASVPSVACHSAQYPRELGCPVPGRAADRLSMGPAGRAARRPPRAGEWGASPGNARPRAPSLASPGGAGTC